MRYRTIVADPPWPIGDFPAWHDEAKRSARELEVGRNPTPYPTMTLDDIRALPIKSLSDNLTGDAHLYLWTCDQFLVEAVDIARAWGFHKMATIVWCKAPMGGGLGGVWPNNVEFVLFCRRPHYQRVDNADYQRLGHWLRQQREDAGMSAKGLCAVIGAHGAINHGGAVSNWENGLSSPTEGQWMRLKQALNLGSDMDGLVAVLNSRKGASRAPSCTETFRTTGRWFNWPRGRHSEKPEAFLDLVEQVSPGPYVELFARRARFGWDYWGNESLGTAELVA